MNLKGRLERLGAPRVGIQPSPASARDEARGDLRRQMRALLERNQLASTACPESVPGFAASPAGEGRVETGKMGVLAFGTSSTLGETRRGLRASPTGERTGWEPHGRRPRLRFHDLPFLLEVTPSGERWSRTERLAVDHRVGRVAVELLASAESRVLAELALDASIAESCSDSWLFLDTETTGLGGSGTLAFLVGMASLDASGRVIVEQLLVRQPSDEAAMLERVAERVRAASLIVSFNGKAFDAPLLEARNVMSRLPRLPDRPHLDLLHVGRRLHRRRLGSCTLKRMESEVLGFERGADIDGSQVGPIYSHFLRSADASALALVVEHNWWDVISMVALVGLYGQRLPPLPAEDLTGLARTLKRAGATLHAERAADAACAQGGGIEALRVRAELAKSRGDCSSAVRDFELLCQEADDPAGRLELAKLYEHQMRRPARALDWVVRGTGEDCGALARRRARLERKIRRNPEPG